MFHFLRWVSVKEFWFWPGCGKFWRWRQETATPLLQTCSQHLCNLLEVFAVSSDACGPEACLRGVVVRIGIHYGSWKTTNSPQRVSKLVLKMPEFLEWRVFKLHIQTLQNLRAKLHLVKLLYDVTNETQKIESWIYHYYVCGRNDTIKRLLC